MFMCACVRNKSNIHTSNRAFFTNVPLNYISRHYLLCRCSSCESQNICPTPTLRGRKIAWHHKSVYNRRLPIRLDFRCSRVVIEPTCSYQWNKQKISYKILDRLIWAWIYTESAVIQKWIYSGCMLAEVTYPKEVTKFQYAVYIYYYSVTCANDTCSFLTVSCSLSPSVLPISHILFIQPRTFDS